MTQTMRRWCGCIGAGLLLLSGCASGNVPASQRGFFGGLSAAVTGDDARRAQSLENTAAREEAVAGQAAQRATAAQTQASITSGQVRAAEQRLAALQKTLREQRATLDQLRRQANLSPSASAEGARLQQQIDALERDRRDATNRVGGPTPATVQQLEQRSQELSTSLEQFKRM